MGALAGARVGRLLELLGLTGFAFAQPILDTLGRSSGYLIFEGATRDALFLAAVLITVAPPLVLWLVTWPALVLHRVAIGVLAALVALLVLPDAPWSLLPAAAAGAAVAVAHARVPTFRSWLKVTAVGAPLFLFTLVTSPAARSLGDVEADLRAARGNGAPVVMVVLDELPTRTLVDANGTIDPVRFPNLAALASTSSWYRNATTVSPHTWHAVPALLTGRLPFESAPSAADHPDSLFTLLGEHYELNVVESFERLCPTSLCDRADDPGSARTDAVDLLGVGRRIWEERVGLREAEGTTGLVEPTASATPEEPAPDDRSLEEILGDDHPQRFGRLLDGIVATDEPVLHYIHLLLPHAPWRYLPDGTTYEPGVEFGVDGDTWTTQSRPRELARHRHLLQAQYVDRLIGELLDRLRRTGLFDRSLIVVTADHGIAFEAGEGRRVIEGGDHSRETLADVMQVPLLVKAPEQHEPLVDDGNVLTVDVLPIVAGLLDIDVPWEIDGRVERTADEKPFFASTSGPFGVAPGEPRPQSAEALRPLLFRDPFHPAFADDPWRDYRLGPTTELLGRPVSEADRAVEVTDDVTFIGNDIAVAGQLDGAVDATTLVVVSVDGIVVGTSAPFSHEGRQTFAVIAPPELARAGGRLAVHLIS